MLPCRYVLNLPPHRSPDRSQAVSLPRILGKSREAKLSWPMFFHSILLPYAGVQWAGSPWFPKPLTTPRGSRAESTRTGGVLSPPEFENLRPPSLIPIFLGADAPLPLRHQPTASNWIHEAQTNFSRSSGFHQGRNFRKLIPAQMNFPCGPPGCSC